MKTDETLCVMRDLNAKMSMERTTDITDQYDLATWKERGEIEFCQQNELLLSNAHFKQHRRKLYTWKSADGDTRNKIDYILLNIIFSNCVNQAKAYPGSDMPRFAMTTGNNILQEEVQMAITSIKNGKPIGSDEIETEILKALDDRNVTTLTKLSNLPTELEKSIFITSHKKAKACHLSHPTCL